MWEASHSWFASRLTFERQIQKKSVIYLVICLFVSNFAPAFRGTYARSISLT